VGSHAAAWTNGRRRGTLRREGIASRNHGKTERTLPLAAKKKATRPKHTVSEQRLAVRRARGDVFELVFPHSVKDREADMEEVRAMLDAGEIDVAVDELRWLLGGCDVLLEAHKLLGEAAMADGDMDLARSHFGCAYELGLNAIPKGGLGGQLPYSRPANRDFFEAGKGLAWCLGQLGETKLAHEVVRQLLALDRTDPVGLKDLLEGIR
jgi:hypothetical protein